MAVFDVSAFRVAFPAFASETAYPDALIIAQSEIGLCYVNVENSACDCATLSWQLIAAHLLYINAQIAGGSSPQGQVSSASVGSVSVSITPPPTKGGLAYWLGMTPYGLQLLALLKKCSAGGAYIGGKPERAAFRSVGGLFTNGGRIL